MVLGERSWIEVFSYYFFALTHFIISFFYLEVQENWKQKVIKSIANAIQWMREQSHTYTLLAADIIQSFVLSGYINDEGVCSNNLNQEKAKLAKEIDHSEKLSGGQLAKSLIGLKASCYDSVKRQSLISMLKRKMSKYPQGEFNNFFQLSLAMIALYVNNVEVPSIYGQKLLRGVFIGKKRFRPLKKDKMSDTEAMGIMALLTLLHQRFTAHWVRKHAQKEVKKAEIKLQKILEDSSENNLATISLILQVSIETSMNSQRKIIKKCETAWSVNTVKTE